MSPSGDSSSRFALAIFDLDGVLVDTTACHAKAYADLWRMLDVDGPPYSAIAGRTTRDSVAEWTADRHPTPAQLESWTQFKQQQARRYLATEPILFSDTLDGLAAAAGRVAGLALGTSASRLTTEVVLARFDLRRFFTVVVTGDDVDIGKPAPDIYRRVMDEADVSESRTLVVEDSEAGLAAALASGAFAVSVRAERRMAHARFLGAFDDLRALGASVQLWAA